MPKTLSRHDLPFEISQEFGPDPQIDPQEDGTYHVRPTPGFNPRWLTAADFVKEVGFNAEEFVRWMSMTAFSKGSLEIQGGKVLFTGQFTKRVLDERRLRQAAARLAAAGGKVPSSSAARRQVAGPAREARGRGAGCTAERHG